MPIYEYQCQNCGQRFELYRSFKESHDPVKCPNCSSEAVERVISLYTTDSSGGSCWPSQEEANESG